ncbi:hypothetical protein [Vibrio fluvialis]|uniref:hypothetical protein n=1 Tax=Vibrio fluvialis TaxID=676 RepID=UPI001C9E0687|nr:hypothetical protein [Vibrio fluvialis]MBY8073752.1 hypothetical protein [Vibrio fluvialis]
MGWLITEKIHYLTKLPLIVIALLLFGLAPIILSIVGGALLQWFTGRSYDESNSAIVASGWFFLITFPVAILGVIVLLIVVIRDSILLYLK